MRSGAPAFSLSLGRLVGQGFAAFGRCFVPFVLLTTLVLSPWIVLRIAAIEHWVEYPPIPGFWFFDLALHWGLAYVATGALTFGVVRRLQNEKASLVQIMSQGLRTFVRVLGTSLLCTVIILACTALLIVPGIVVAVRVYVAVPAAVMERCAGPAAMVRSGELTAGSRGAIFGAWLLVKVVQIGYPVLLQFLLLSMFRRRAFDESALSRYAWADVAGTILIDAFAATMAAVCYFQLRQGKENVDAKQIAAVFA